LNMGCHFLPRQAWTTSFILCCTSWDDRCMPPHPPFSIKMGFQELFSAWADLKLKSS
jgi:hypothetical protein